jgi:ribonuclease HI
MAKPTDPHRGAGLFGDHEPEGKPAVPAAWRANIDGGSRGNPGPAEYIGRATNNVAEYYGLIAALDYAQSNSVRALHIESDSELLVKQMRGQYKVKSADLQPLFERAKKMSQSFASFRINHVYREQNREADALANEAMDEVSGAPRAESGKAKMEKSNSPAGSGAAASAIRVRARFRSGVLYPLEDLNLPDGAEVEIVLRPASRT